MRLDESFTHEWVITENIYNKFIDLSNDKNPVHTNKKFALKFGFKEKVVHGNLLNVFLSYVIGELLPTKSFVIIDQSIKYKNPIYIGMTIKIYLNVKKLVQSVDIINFNFFFEEKKSKKKLAIGEVTIKELS